MTSDVVSVIGVATLKTRLPEILVMEGLRPPAEGLCHVSIAAASTRSRPLTNSPPTDSRPTKRFPSSLFDLLM